jgi:6-phospho-3-hexuloisomerase
MLHKSIGEETQDIAAEVLGALVVCEEGQAHRLIEAIVQADEVFLTGQGRTGLIARAFVIRLVHLGLKAHFVGDITTPPIGKGDLLIACSGSGVTHLTKLTAERAKHHGAKVAAIVGRTGSPLGKAVDLAVGICEVPEGLEHGILPMASRFELALLFYLEVIVLRLMRQLKITEEEMRQRHANLE